MVLVEADDHKTRFDLSTELRIERMAELQRFAALDLPFQCKGLQAADIRVRQGIFRMEDPGLVSLVVIEHEHGRIHEARQQLAPRPKHAMAFAPHRRHVRHKHVRCRIHDEIE